MVDSCRSKVDYPVFLKDILRGAYCSTVVVNKSMSCDDLRLEKG